MNELFFALALILAIFIASIAFVLIGIKLVSRLLDNQPVAYSTVIFEGDDE